MALPVTMYRWDDPGAPQVVDGKPSEYMDVLKKCLVEGYGAKTALGWTIENELADPLHIAFKNDTGSEIDHGYLMLSAPNDNAGQITEAQSCLSYISNTVYSKAGYKFGIGRYSTGTNLLKNWMLIGTGKAFYLIISRDNALGSNYFGAAPHVSFFAGSINSVIPNDPATFVTMCGGRGSTTVSRTNTLLNVMTGSTPTNIGIVYSTDGSESSAQISLNSLFGTPFGRNQAFNSNVDITHLSPITVHCGVNVLSSSPNVNDLVLPYFKGVLPGAYMSPTLSFREQPMPFIKEIDGINYWLLPAAYNETGGVWLNMEQW